MKTTTLPDIDSVRMLLFRIYSVEDDQELECYCGFKT